MGCLRVWLRNSGLEKGLHAAQAPAVGTSVEALSMGDENAPYSINKLAETTVFIQTTRFSCCSTAAFPLICELQSLLKKNWFFVVLFIILFLFTIVTKGHWLDISNQACQSCKCSWSSCLSEILRTPNFLRSQFLSLVSPWKIQLKYPLCSKSLIRHFTKMDVTITWPMKLQGS